MKTQNTNIQIFSKSDLKVNEATQAEILKRWHEYERLVKLENCVRALFGSIPCEANEDWKNHVSQFVSELPA